MAKEAIRDILAAEEQARKRIQDAKEQGKSLMEEQKQRLETQKKQRLAQIHKENEEFLQKAEAEERRAVDPLLKEAEKNLKASGGGFLKAIEEAPAAKPATGRKKKEDG